MSKFIVYKLLALLLLQACESRCRTRVLNQSRINELDAVMQKLHTTSLKEVLMWEGIVFPKSDHVHLDRVTGLLAVSGSPQFCAQVNIWVKEVSRGRTQKMLADLDAQNSCFP